MNKVPRIGVGFCLHSDLEYLTLAREIIELEADYYEVNPEAMWRPAAASPAGEQQGNYLHLERNDYHSLFLQIMERSRRPIVAHGLGFSPLTPMEGDSARTAAWLDRLRDDQRMFQFPWMSEHLGWTTVDGIMNVLPLPFLYNEESLETAAARLRALATVVPVVAFENNVAYFHMEDPRREPEFFNLLMRRADCGLMLDLHNAYTQCINNGTDVNDYLSQLDLERVVQIHLSGGSESDAAWLPSRRVMRLDSHDDTIPEAVWSLYERTLPKCKNIGGVVVERLNATFDASGALVLRDEVRRAREVWRANFARRGG